MAGFNNSLISVNYFTHILDALLRSLKGHSLLLALMPIFSVWVVSFIHSIDLPSKDIFYDVHSWSFIAVSINIIAATVLVIFIVLVDCVYGVLKQVEHFH